MKAQFTESTEKLQSLYPVVISKTAIDTTQNFWTTPQAKAFPLTYASDHG